MIKEIKKLIEMSKYAGERFDLVQAGGGNSSVKLEDGTMLIKASGFSLSDVDFEKGYSRVNTKSISDIVSDTSVLSATTKRERESVTADLVKKSTLDPNNKPSIETLLHSLLYKYTLHVHPIVVNKIVIKKNWQETLNSIFSKENIALIEYETPGIELALKLNENLKKISQKPKIIFLQNHGLIITSDHYEDIQLLMENVLIKIEKYLNIDFSIYRSTNKITHLLNKLGSNGNISYLCEDYFVKKMFKGAKDIFFKTPFCPDKLVYCGISIVELDNFDDVNKIIDYKDKYHELPKVIVVQDNIYFIALNIRKAKEIEDVFKFHLLTLEDIGDDVNFLKYEELAYLMNWDAEKYRQKI